MYYALCITPFGRLTYSVTIFIMDKKSNVIRDLQSRNCLKVIAGINNFNKDNVLQIVRAADQMQATCVDISAREDIVTEAVAIARNTAIVVSSVNVAELIRAEELGADVLELGNFEALHDEGIFPNANQVYDWASEIMSARHPAKRSFASDAALKKVASTKSKNFYGASHALVSITIPGHLSVAEQVELATKLEVLGVDILQTEGASLVEAKSAAVLGQIEKASLTLANTIEISKAVSETFIITASGISPDTAKLAIAAGAHGIGVGKYVNKLESSLEMMAAIKALQEALSVQSSKNVLETSI